MSATGGPDEIDPEEQSRRTVFPSYSTRNPVPTVQKYYQVKQERRREEGYEDGETNDQSEGMKGKIQQKLGLISPNHGSKPPYQSVNRNDFANGFAADKDPDDSMNEDKNGRDEGSDQQSTERVPSNDDEKAPKDTTESSVVAGDAREKRKAMKKREPKGTRIVTDPVTHLQMAIHDFTGNELESTPENFEAPGTRTKSDEEIAKEEDEITNGDRGVRRVFPPPSFDVVRKGVLKSTRKALLWWTLGLFVLVVATVVSISYFSRSEYIRERSWQPEWLPGVVTIAMALLVLIGYSLTVNTWLTNQVNRIWDDNVWQAARLEEAKQAEFPVPESTQWLNRLMASIWPLVNPDLFVSMADMIEDVMQASLPSFVRMVAVEDIGQGSESIRLLGVRWLPAGSAAKSVNVEGNVKPDQSDEGSDRIVQGKGQVQRDDSSQDKDEKQDQEDQSIAEGLEKEEGEFVNMEVAFAYRARDSEKSLSKRAKNAHLLIKFYLPGSLPIPIWVTLQGIVGVVRMRLQLTPDPPFIALATVTLVGQPKAEMQAIPLAKRFLNVMDLPFISGFVQSSIDAALAEYVAPRSLTLNLKEMLTGDDFKKDTVGRGVIIVHIKKAYGFKEADFSIPGVKEGSADPYVSVGWAKFGKPVWSTRVILNSMNPVWDEAAFLLVTPEELNAEERVRVQLWDSDRFTADDDVGRIEVDLKEIMHGESRGRMNQRKDGFIALQANERMPGQLEWSIGYFPKVRLTPKQIRQQKVLPEVDGRQQLKEVINEEAERKMREASTKDMSGEIQQNKEAGLVEKEVEMTAAAPPPEGYPTGILSIQLHNITGLHLQVLSKSRDQFRNEGAEGGEVSDDLPSAYATVILNGQKVFKTRTKPKNSKPFFNASTERVVRDWRRTELMISVRDARVHEDDALMGVVYLNLGDVFSKRSQVNSSYPLVGGVGFGRFRISLVFRACVLQLPKQFLGWEYGTLEIGRATSDDLPNDLHGMRLKVKGPLNKGRLRSKGSDRTQWKRRKHGNLLLGMAHRYSSCITVEFRKSVSGPNVTAAFGIFWLKDIPDGEGKTIEMPIWRGGRSKEFDRLRTHCTDDCKDEKVGTLKVDVKFWPGLSEFHRGLASKSVNLHNVMEVLDMARDNNLVDTNLYDGDAPSEVAEDDNTKDEGKNNQESNDDEDDSSDSGESDGEDSIDMNNGNDYHDYNGMTDSDGENEEPDSLKNSKHPQERGRDPNSENQGEDDGQRGPVEQIQDFRRHRKTLHRQQKGAMQWKVPRTMRWMKHKVESGKDKLVGTVAHHDREPDIETEA